MIARGSLFKVLKLLAKLETPINITLEEQLDESASTFHSLSKLYSIAISSRLNLKLTVNNILCKFSDAQNFKDGIKGALRDLADAYEMQQAFVIKNTITIVNQNNSKVEVTF